MEGVEVVDAFLLVIWTFFSTTVRLLRGFKKCCLFLCFLFDAVSRFSQSAPSQPQPHPGVFQGHSKYRPQGTDSFSSCRSS